MLCYGNMIQHPSAPELADYRFKCLDELHSAEASAARVLCERVRDQPLG